MRDLIQKELQQLKSGLSNIEKAIQEYNSSLDVFQFSTDKICAELDGVKFEFVVGIEAVSVEEVTVMLDWGKDNMAIIKIETSVLRKRIESEAPCSEERADSMIFDTEYRDAVCEVIKDIVKEEY